MKIFNFILKTTLTTLITAFCLQNAYPAVPIDSTFCGQTLAPGAEYKLVENLNCSASQGIAALILSEDTKLFLNNLSITADPVDPPSSGIRITNGGKNQVIGPGTIEGFQDSNILISGVHKNLVKDVSLLNSPEGIRVLASNQNKLINNNLVVGSAGISLASDSRINTVTHNRIECITTGCSGINSQDNANNNLIHDNKIIRASFGILVQNSNLNTISSNKILEPGNIGIGLLDEANFNKVKENTINNALQIAMGVDGSDGNKLVKNKIENPVSAGISIARATATLIKENSILNPVSLVPGGGIQIIESDGNTVAKNKVDGSGDIGIALSRANLNRVKDNLILNSTGNGITLQDDGEAGMTSSNDNRITSNVIENSGQNGIFLQSDNTMPTSIVNFNIIAGNKIKHSQIQAISILSLNDGLITGNLITENHVKHDTKQSPAFSECPDPQDNTWKINRVNFKVISGTPPCENP